MNSTSSHDLDPLMDPPDADGPPQYDQPGSAQLPSWIISTQDVTADADSPLGSAGRAGSVFKGTWKTALVAVKLLPKGTVADILHSRAKVWQSLKHAHVLQVYGASGHDAHPLFIVSQYLQNGDAMAYLVQNPTADRAQIVFETALGMQYLHGRGLVHGSLKPSNILITDNGQACVADCGMIELKPTGNEFAHRYHSPEAWKGTLSKPVDVFAFATSAYEIFTSTPPWGVLSDTQIYKLVVREGERPDRPEEELEQQVGLTDHIWAIIEDAWHKESRARPNFEKIVGRWRSHSAGVSHPVQGIQGPNTLPNPHAYETQSNSSTSSAPPNTWRTMNMDEQDDDPQLPAYPGPSSNNTYAPHEKGRPVSVPITQQLLPIPQPVLPPTQPLNLSRRPVTSYTPSTGTSEEGQQSGSGARPNASAGANANVRQSLPARGPGEVAAQVLHSRPSSIGSSAPGDLVPSPNLLGLDARSVSPAPLTGASTSSQQSSSVAPTRSVTFRSPVRRSSTVSSAQGASAYGRSPAIDEGQEITYNPPASRSLPQSPAYGGAPARGTTLGFDESPSYPSSSNRGSLPVDGVQRRSTMGGSHSLIGANAVILSNALQAEVSEGRKREAIDDLLAKIQILASESEKEAQKLITAGVVPTLILLLKARAVDGLGLEIVLLTLGTIACDTLSANTIYRTNTPATLIEIFNTTISDEVAASSAWCLNRICRTAELAAGLIKQDVASAMIRRGLNAGQGTSRHSCWCLGSLIHTDALAEAMVAQNLVQMSVDQLWSASQSPDTEAEDICAAIYLIARLARTIKISKALAKAGCVTLIADYLNSSEDPQILLWSARAIGCMMRPNSSDMAKILLDAGAARGLARLPQVIPTEEVEPLASFAFAIQRFSCAEWGSGTRKALVEAGVVDSLLAALRTAGDVPYPQVHIELALAVSFLGDVGGAAIRKEIMQAGGIDILKRVGAEGKPDVAKACNMAVTSITGNLLTRSAASAKTALTHNWNGGCPDYQPECPLALVASETLDES